MEIKAIIDSFASTKKKAVERNRADEYRARPEVKLWLERCEREAKQLDEWLKEHAPTITAIDRLGLDDLGVKMALRELNRDKSAAGFYITTKKWLAALDDTDFVDPQMADFEARCRELNGRLAQVRLGATLTHMKSLYGQLCWRLSELHKAYERHGLTAVKSSIENVIPADKAGSFEVHEWEGPLADGLGK